MWKGFVMPQPTSATLDAIDYPDSDGQPMAESEFQLNPILYAVGSLRVHFQHRPDVYVAGDLLLYYEEGNRAAAVAPDVFVVFGVPKHARRIYQVWREGEVPAFVMEVTSRSTRQDDQGRKRDIYERLGVSEYWQYDPTGDYLDPPLQGLMLSGGRYGRSLAPERVGAVWSAYSPVLGLNLRLDEGVLRFHDPLTDAYLLSHQETADRLRESEQARREAEARLADVEARLRALQPSTLSGRPDPSDK